MFPNQFGVYLHDNPRRELFQEVGALFQRRLRAARGCRAARPLAVRARPRLAVGRHRAAGAAGAAGAGLHHLSDGNARRRVDRLFRRRLRPRRGEAGGAARCGTRARSPAASAAASSGNKVTSCATGRPYGIARRIEAHVTKRQLAHQGVDRRIAARSRRRGSSTTLPSGLTRIDTPTLPARNTGRGKRAIFAGRECC